MTQDSDNNSQQRRANAEEGCSAIAVAILIPAIAIPLGLFMWLIDKSSLWVLLPALGLQAMAINSAPKYGGIHALPIAAEIFLAVATVEPLKVGPW